ncbi:Hypothetical predicted protein [Mytilus galloprovincialis]|uniref:B box-type domain-containing protein n=1 Tax=Mytilus galloprovincialis TaxID=29158 RepID=A0A8B6BWU3_MYTGA|nr:Hypothetical predicted protein [Mytilus galloprovincialis]
MALSKSMQKAQIPLPCELCEIETKIQWKCIDCILLLCDKCKNKVHSKFKKAKDHKIITIKEVGLHGDDSGQNISDTQCKDQQDTQIRIKAIREYTTELSQVVHIIQCSDNGFWIHDCDSEKIQKVTLQPDSSLKVLLELKDFAQCTSLTRNGDLLISDLTSNLQILNGNGKKLTISIYNFKSYKVDPIHINKENQLIVGAIKKSPVDYSVPGGGVVIVINMDGNIKPNITKEDERGRVVTLEKGTILNVYSGHADINSKNHPFKPQRLVATQKDNIIVSDTLNNTLHILDNSGHLLFYCNTMEAGVMGPFSMVVIEPGKLLIGCSTPVISANNAKIYEVEISKDI